MCGSTAWRTSISCSGLVFSATWDLPIFRERKDLIGNLFGGWELDALWIKHSGFPWTPKIFSSLRQPSGKFFGPIRPIRYFGGAGGYGPAAC